MDRHHGGWQSKRTFERQPACRPGCRMSDLQCIIQMVGGLGNQMFQYALCRRLQISRGANVRFDLEMYKHDTERALTLSNYRTTIPQVSAIDKATMRLSLGRTFAKIG